MNDYILCEKCQNSVHLTEIHEGMCAKCHLDKIRLESAAPDLLEACKQVVNTMGCICICWLEQKPCPVCVVQAAIAKAKGES